jgi:hypothetical protein
MFFTEHEKKNNHALMVLCATINKKILPQLVNCKTSRKMWKKIILLHTQKATQNVDYLQEKFYNLQMQDTNDLAN